MSPHSVPIIASSSNPASINETRTDVQKKSAPSASKPNLTLLTGKILNLLSYLSFCVLVGGGLLLYFKLPPARGMGPTEALGFTRHQWGEFHAWVSFAFIALIATHLILHWKWLVSVAVKRRTPWLWAGIFAGIAIIVGFLLIPVSIP